MSDEVVLLVSGSWLGLWLCICAILVRTKTQVLGVRPYATSYLATGAYGFAATVFAMGFVQPGPSTLGQLLGIITAGAFGCLRVLPAARDDGTRSIRPGFRRRTTARASSGDWSARRRLLDARHLVGQRWRTEMSTVRPTDRAVAEAAADELHRMLGYTPPREHRWVRSPAELVATLEEASPSAVRLEFDLENRWIGRDAPKVAEAIQTMEGAAVSPLAIALRYQLARDRLASAETQDLAISPDERLRRFASGSEAHVLAEGRGTVDQRAVAVRRLLTACDGWVAFDGWSVFQETPVEIHRDPLGRLHREDGPAIAYADGWAAWAWHGTPLDRMIVEAPERLTFDDVRGEPDRTRRRIMHERFGPERYRTEALASGALTIRAEPDATVRRDLIAAFGEEQYVQAAGLVLHEDVDGLGHPRRLWRAVRGGDDPLMYVEVVNSTPEPDGSNRSYWLRVPPTMRDCQSAVAWTFGIPAPRFLVTAES